MVRYENWKTADQGKGCSPEYREKTLAEEIWPDHLLRMRQEIGLQEAIEEELDDSTCENCLDPPHLEKEIPADKIRSEIHDWAFIHRECRNGICPYDDPICLAVQKSLCGKGAER